MNRHQRRADQAAFKREVSHTGLLTHLFDARMPLEDRPLLCGAVRFWRDGIATRKPRCFGCTVAWGLIANPLGSCRWLGAGGLLTAPRSRGYFRPRIRSAARSAMAMVAAFTIACGNDGITDASTTRRPWVPRTRNARSTTAFSSVPIRQVPTG